MAGTTATEIIKALSQCQFHYKDEKELQQGIAQLLTSLGLEYQAEVILTAADRIDFMVGRIGIEVKIDSSASAVTRQLFRYSLLPEIDELILVSTRSKHCAQPITMNAKPLHVVYLLGSIF